MVYVLCCVVLCCVVLKKIYDSTEFIIEHPRYIEMLL